VDRQRYLHEAMRDVMKPGVRYTTRQISDEIACRRLYTRRDGGPPPPSQIAARAAGHKRLFRREGRRLVRIDNL